MIVTIFVLQMWSKSLQFVCLACCNDLKWRKNTDKSGSDLQSPLINILSLLSSKSRRFLVDDFVVLQFL